jgi:3-methyladenine DNA glycosylase AlkC
MRDLFFNEPGIRELAALVRRAWPPFDAAAFLKAVLPRLPALGLNERNFLVRDALRAHLPGDFRKAADILVRSLGPELPSAGPDSYAGFYVMALNAYIAEYGIDDHEHALPALRELTKRFSAEFAIRPFLDRHPERTLAILHAWARDAHPQVRRLASEGSRPRLPWGMRLQKFVKDPRPVLALLEHLKEDPELFVRRSVANNLNDIAKDHPDLVVATLKRWQKSRNPDTQWLVKHALRTLLKQGHPEALELLGYSRDARVKVEDLVVSPKRVKLGGAVTFRFHVRSQATTAQPVMIDYIMHHRKANGATRPKVFKLTTRKLKPGEVLAVEKRHSFRPIGIRPYYPGRHAIEIQINGQVHARAEFGLTV